MTRIFLDVDGVLNALSPQDQHPEGHWGDFDHATCMGFNILYSKRMGQALTELGAPITWLTTWENQANEWICPLYSWERKPVLARNYLHHRGHWWWKSELLQAAISTEDEPAPFIWIDDDLRQSRNDIQWLLNCGIPYLTISPNPSFGITPSHIQMMRNFILENLDV